MRKSEKESILDLEDIMEFDDFEECYYEGVSRRKANIRIDGYSMDETDGSCCIFISDYHGPHEDDAVRADDITAAFNKVRHFVTCHTRGQRTTDSNNN